MLPVVDLPGLRPTTDRVRETLFNWLQNEVPGAHCLDLFSGSGALGFEAASRGADSVTLLELQVPAVKILRQNIEALGAQNTVLVQADAISWLREARKQPVSDLYDIVFIDPPFGSDLLDQVCQMLVAHPCLSSHATLYFEMNVKQALPELPENWHIIKNKKAGQVQFCLVKLVSDK